MIKVGDTLPAVDFFVRGEDDLQPRTSADLFSGKKVVLFGLPGAFTPTCHRNHLPGYIDCIDGIRALGVDEVAVVSVNDAWVMDAWEKASGAKGRIAFLADGNADFARATGLDVDLSVVGLGTRLQRFSMIVEDGVVKSLNLEEEHGSTEKTGAVAIIEQLKDMA